MSNGHFHQKILKVLPRRTLCGGGRDFDFFFAFGLFEADANFVVALLLLGGRVCLFPLCVLDVFLFLAIGVIVVFFLLVRVFNVEFEVGEGFSVVVAV